MSLSVAPVSCTQHVDTIMLCTPYRQSCSSLRAGSGVQTAGTFDVLGEADDDDESDDEEGGGMGVDE